MTIELDVVLETGMTGSTVEHLGSRNPRLQID